jgi:hypothetical protein
MSRNRRSPRQPRAATPPPVSVGGSQFQIGPAAAALNAQELQQAGVSLAQLAAANQSVAASATAATQSLSSESSQLTQLTRVTQEHTQATSAATIPARQLNQLHQEHSQAAETANQGLTTQTGLLQRLSAGWQAATTPIRGAAGEMLNLAGIYGAAATPIGLVTTALSTLANEAGRMTAAAGDMEDWERSVGLLPESTRTLNDLQKQLDATRTSAEALGGELLAPGAGGFLTFLNDALKSLRDSFADPMHPEQIERANLYADALARVPQLLNQSNQEMHDLQQQANLVRSSTEAQLRPLQDQLDLLRRARAEHEALRSLSEAEAQLAQDQKDALDVSGPLGVSARRNLLADTQREAQARDAFNYFQQTQGIADRMNQIQAQGQQDLTPILDRITTLLENIYNLRQGKTPEVISAETGRGMAYYGGYLAYAERPGQSVPGAPSLGAYVAGNATPGIGYGAAGYGTSGIGFGTPSGGSAGMYPGRASGGPVTEGWWRVGENGPEWLHAGGSGYVVPNAAGSQHLLGLCLNCHKEFTIENAADPRVARASDRGIAGWKGR